MTTTQIADLAALLEDAPDDAVFTQVLGRGHGVTVTVLSVPSGESIPPHTNANEAVAFILKGRAMVTVGGDTRVVAQGSWVHFPPRLRHSLVAREQGFEMLLVVLKSP